MPVIVCKFQNRQKDHLINIEIPSYPFQNVEADLFIFRVQEYLINRDYYSQWFEIDKLTFTPSLQVISELKVRLHVMVSWKRWQPITDHSFHHKNSKHLHQAGTLKRSHQVHNTLRQMASARRLSKQPSTSWQRHQIAG